MVVLPGKGVLHSWKGTRKGLEDASMKPDYHRSDRKSGTQIPSEDICSGIRKPQRIRVLWPGPCSLLGIHLHWDFLPLALPRCGHWSFPPAAHPTQELLVVPSLVCPFQNGSLSHVPSLAHKMFLLCLGLTPLHYRSRAASVSRGLLTMSLRLTCTHVWYAPACGHEEELGKCLAALSLMLFTL